MMSEVSRPCISEVELLKAIKGEAEAIPYYEKLIKKSSDHEDKRIIEGIKSDEVKHLKAFKILYRELFGREPSIPKMHETHIPSFFDGALKSVVDELEAFEFYRDIILKCMTNPMILKIFIEAMTDENEHAQYFNLMMNKFNRRK